MAIAGRSYANVPVIIRGSLEDSADFNSKTQLVVIASQPDCRQLAPATILTSANPATQPATVAIPPPVIITPPPDSRQLGGALTVITGSPLASGPPAPPALPPVVIAGQPDYRWLQPATILRAVNPAPGVATIGIPPPVIIAGQPDYRWLQPATVLAAANPAARIAPPVVVPPLNALRLSGFVSGSNIQDYTGSGLGGTVS